MVARVYSSVSAKRKEQGQLVALREARGGNVFLSGRGREATRSGGTRPPWGKSGREWKGSLQTAFSTLVATESQSKAVGLQPPLQAV